MPARLSFSCGTTPPSLARSQATRRPGACKVARSCLARSLFRRRGPSGDALCEPRGREDGPAWRGNVKRAGMVLDLTGVVGVDMWPCRNQQPGAETRKGYPVVALRVRFKVKCKTLLVGNHLSRGTPNGGLSIGMSTGQTLHFTLARTRRR
jgi:hypothetical protein